LAHLNTDRLAGQGLLSSFSGLSEFTGSNLRLNLLHHTKGA